jgi:DNA-binding CsgD family transcriptional regulator/tetratricopeptide (TPR) repeat protein
VAISSALECARSRTSSAVLIEGHAGAGCSRLLSAVAEVGVAAGFSVASGSASRVTWLAPLTPLLEAIDALPGGPNSGWAGRLPGELLDEAAACLKRHAGRKPTVVVLDDLQRADPMLLAALRVLSVRLRSHPLVWVFARHAGEAGPGADEFVRDLEDAVGATRVVLLPLDTAAVREIVTDLLGAEPADDLVALADRAGGNPGLLTDLVLGSRRDGSIDVVEGHGILRSWRPPRQLELNVLQQLERLTAAARQFVEVGAVLGSVFEIDDIVRLTATPAVKILPVLRELLDTGLVVICDEGCRFTSELFWETVVATLPTPAREALHLQAAEMLLERGDAPDAASHLKRSHDPGNPQVLMGLNRAMGQLLSAAPVTAAEIAVQVLDLTDPADPAWDVRALAGVGALAVVGRLGDAAALVRKSLGRTISRTGQAALRCSLSAILYLQGKCAEATTLADAVLDEPGLPESAYATARLAKVQSLSRLADPSSTASSLTDGADGAATGALGAWNAGRLSESLRLAREAIDQSSKIRPSDLTQQVARQCALFQCVGIASALGDPEPIRHLREEYFDLESEGHPVERAFVAVLLARNYLVGGNFARAVAEAERSLRIGRTYGCGLVVGAALGVLANATFRRGDLSSAAGYVGEALGYRDDLPATSAIRITWAAAMLAEARKGGACGLAVIGEICERPQSRRLLLVEEPVAAAWMVRLALAAGDRRGAELVSDVATEIARENPGQGYAEAAASHARALVTGDSALLDAAMTQQLNGWARASAAEDLGVRVRTESSQDPQVAVTHLESALAGFESAGAARDSARVRRRLRDLGVRRRHWTRSERPTSGWASLTETELTVANLVTEGLTNRLVADRMFLSAHTVAFHLRHIFVKLNITSRVDLARLGAQHPHEASKLA